MNKKLKFAIYLAGASALISGLNNFLTKVAVTVVNDPIVFTWLKNALVGAGLVVLILFRRTWPEMKKLTRPDWYKLLAVGVIGGSIPFILYFTGLKMVSAVNAGFIHKTLFIWVALLAVPLLKEKIGKVQWVALLLLVGGNLVLFGWPRFTFGRGEMLILLATLMWAVENIIAKQALQNVSSTLLATVRMAIGSIIILSVVIGQGHLGLISNLSLTQWSWTIITSVLLLGYVLTWYTALKYAPATLVASILVPATFITNFLTAIFITHHYPNNLLISAILFVGGLYLLVNKENSRLALPSQQPRPIGSPEQKL